jgi:Fe-Mn family superoxide dismutase
LNYPFQLPTLRFSYAALEPYFDETTMRVHHDKHHRSYVDNLNAAIKDHPQLHGMTVEELLGNPGRIPEAIRTAVRNNGGGHANHQLLWNVIGPPRHSEPKGQLVEAINSRFGSFGHFKAMFADAAVKHLGSGWIFLIADPRKQSLEIVSLPNHQCVVGINAKVLLICDVWEHAYYLKYQDRRTDFLSAYWNVVAWDRVEQRMPSSHVCEAFA